MKALFTIRDLEFVISCADAKQAPETDWPEVAFAGRSNVGKSSLINAIIGRRKMMKVSNTPGRTQLINFLAVNKLFHLVDLPGYGFAKVSKSMRAQWGKLIGTYLSERENLRACVQILDIRHDPTNEDLALYEWLLEAQIPVIVVVTKSDKLSNQKIKAQTERISKQLGLLADDLVVFSAQTKRGVDEVWTRALFAMELEAELNE